MACASVVVNTAVFDKVPASLGFVSKEHVCAIIPAQPAPHSLRKTPGITLRRFMHPVSHWTFKICGMSCDLLRELSLQSWEDIVEWQSVCCQVNPARVCSEDCESLSWPETIRLAIVGDIRVELSHVTGKTFHVVFPEGIRARNIKILLEDARPLLASNAFVNCANSLGTIHSVQLEL